MFHFHRLVWVLCLGLLFISSHAIAKSVCGNKIVEAGEQCDSGVQTTCLAMGFKGGLLGCHPKTCQYVTNRCFNDYCNDTDPGDKIDKPGKVYYNIGGMPTNAVDTCTNDKQLVQVRCVQNKLAFKYQTCPGTMYCEKSAGVCVEAKEIVEAEPAMPPSESVGVPATSGLPGTPGSDGSEESKCHEDYVYTQPTVPSCANGAPKDKTLYACVYKYKSTQNPNFEPCPEGTIYTNYFGPTDYACIVADDSPLSLEKISNLVICPDKWNKTKVGWGNDKGAIRCLAPPSTDVGPLCGKEGEQYKLLSSMHKVCCFMP